MFERYSRQVAYWGEKKQAEIKKSSVFVAGVGGLGGILSAMLVRAGIGKIYICDNGIIDAPDLNRQFLYNESNLGKKKVKIAKNLLEKMNSETQIIGLESSIDENFDFEFDSVNIIADCLDNYSSRFILYDKILNGAFYVHGGVDAVTGQVLTLKKGKSKDLRNIFAGLNDSTEIIPVTPDSVNIVSSVMVREIFNIIFGNPVLLNKFWIMSFEGFFTDFMDIP
jgi:molybdopterin/thiamine biosynthesis adenylyltransferase